MPQSMPAVRRQAGLPDEYHTANSKRRKIDHAAPAFPVNGRPKRDGSLAIQQRPSNFLSTGPIPICNPTSAPVCNVVLKQASPDCFDCFAAVQSPVICHASPCATSPQCDKPDCDQEAVCCDNFCPDESCFQVDCHGDCSLQCDEPCPVDCHDACPTECTLTCAEICARDECFNLIQQQEPQFCSLHDICPPGAHPSQSHEALHHGTPTYQHLYEHALHRGFDHYHDMMNHSYPPLQDISQSLPWSTSTPTSTPVLSPSSNVTRTPAQQPAVVGTSENACQWIHYIYGPCTSSFNTSVELQNHVKYDHVHNIEKTDSGFTCQWDDCGKVFKSKSHLERHILTHTNYLPYECAECHRGFTTHDQLKNHLTTHTTDKPFSCTWPGCNKSFGVQSALMTHMNVHTKTKPYKCTICGDGHADSSNLSKHKKNCHTGETAIPCPDPSCDYKDTRQGRIDSHCRSCGHGIQLLTQKDAWRRYCAQFRALKSPRNKQERSRSSTVSSSLAAIV